MVAPRDGWRPPVVQASAATGDGVAALAEAIDQHRAWLRADPTRQRGRAEARAGHELERLLREGLMRELRDRVVKALFDDAIARIASRRIDAHTAATQLIDELLGTRRDGTQATRRAGPALRAGWREREPGREGRRADEDRS